MRALLKVLAIVVVSAIATRLAGLVVSRQFNEGSEVSDEFRRMVIMDGVEFSSHARGLRSVEISVVMGGARLDLRDAVIDPAGARVLAENTMGGLLILVRDDWDVTVDDTLVGGGESRVQVTPSEDLPDDAPKLRVQVFTRIGGTAVSTKDFSPR